MRRTFYSFVFLSAIMIIMLIKCGAVLAVDRYVELTGTCGGNTPCYANIQAAIDAAVIGDIVHVANGTYTDAGNYDIDFKGKAITVQSDGGPTTCIINVGGTFKRGFIFQNNEGSSSILSGFTITNANHFNGAGIYCDGASPTIITCHFIENAANNDGGGMYIGNGSSPGISDCLFSSNTAVSEGGGIYSENSSPLISNCQFNNNTADINGGGICCSTSSSAVITDSSFSSNAANHGGGIACKESSPEISNTSLDSNSADYSGGGIHCNSASPEINGCAITNNTATRQGGGIYCESSSDPNISNSIIETNLANGVGGGGIYCRESSPNISNCSLSGNTVPSGSGGGIYGYNAPFSISFCDINDNVVSLNGGGICCILSGPTICISTIANNSADSGAGIYLDSSGQNFDAPALIDLVLISNNTAAYVGGGVYAGTSYAWIINSIIRNNSATHGGGIRCSGSLFPNTDYQPAIINCILNNNTADYGAGVDLHKSIATIKNSTFYGNTATEASGGIRHYTYSGTTIFPVITNTILWNDEPSEIDVILGPIFVGYSNIQGGYSGVGTNNIDSDPLFINPVSGDFYLSSGSPCIDAATSDNTPTVDIFGTARWDDPDTPNNGGGTMPYFDMGAIEYYPQCQCDLEPAEGDSDVDGVDLIAYIADNVGISMDDFAGEYGRTDCP